MDLVSLIRNILAQNGGSLMGSRLGAALIERGVSQSDFKPLAAFVRQNVPDVEWDSVTDTYRLRDAHPEQPPRFTRSVSPGPEMNEPEPNVWHAFTRPRSMNRVFLDTIEKRLIARFPSASADSALMLIASVTPSEFQDIAKQFVSIAPEDLRDRLSEALASTQEWWSEWKRVMPTVVERNWMGFRSERLEHLFEKRLEVLSLDESVRASLVAQLRQAQAAARARRNEMTPAPAVHVSRRGSFGQGERLIVEISGYGSDRVESVSIKFK
jgi:hypothetical protein